MFRGNILEWTENRLGARKCRHRSAVWPSPFNLCTAVSSPGKEEDGKDHLHHPPACPSLPSVRSGRRGGGLPSAPEGQWQGRGDLLPVEGSPGTPLSPCPEPQLCDVNPSQAAAPGMLSGQALRTLSWSRRQAALQINRPGRAPWRNARSDLCPFWG